MQNIGELLSLQTLSQAYLFCPVIIGAASGGAQTARNLEKALSDQNYRVVLIDRQENVFWPISALRAAVKPGWEDKAMSTTPISAFFGKNSRHVAIGNAEAVNLSANEVVVKSMKALPEGLGEAVGENMYKIPFAYAAVATGYVCPILCFMIAKEGFEHTDPHTPSLLVQLHKTLQRIRLL